jgi:hypothetical protein
MGCVQRIIIIEQYKAVGSNGTELWFIPYRAYCYDQIVTLEVPCTGCSVGKYAREKFYQITINDELFLLPKAVGASDVHELDQIFQDLRVWRDSKFEQPADMWKIYKEITGIDLKKRNTVEHNGYGLHKVLSKTGTGEEVGVNSKE